MENNWHVVKEDDRYIVLDNNCLLYTSDAADDP